MTDLELFLASLAKEAITEIGPTERDILGEAVKAAFKGHTNDAGRLIALVSESIAAKLATDKMHP